MKVTQIFLIIPNFWMSLQDEGQLLFTQYSKIAAVIVGADTECIKLVNLFFLHTVKG